MQRALVLLGSLCLLLLGACGHQSGPSASSPAAPAEPAVPVPAQPDPPAAAGPLALPAPASLLTRPRTSRRASYVEADLVRSGSAYEDALPLSRVARNGSQATFLPSFGGGNQGPNDLAYAVYQFTAVGYDRDPSLRLTWASPPAAGTLWVALADFTTNRWVWYQPTGDTLTLTGLSDYIAADGRVFAVLALTGTTTTQLDSLRLGSLPPVPVLQADVRQGPSPVDVNFSFTGSADPDGTIALYEIDFDGDGTFDQSFTSDPGAVLHTYSTAGIFYAVLRVTDDAGVKATTSLDVIATASGGTGPSAASTYGPTSGAVPLTVNFDASLSSDTTGEIVDYAWDFNEDGIYEWHGATPTTQYTFVNAGTFNPVLRVVDNNGRISTSHGPPVVTTAPGNLPPTAQLSITPQNADFPQSYQFDASASFDSDGSVVKYQWDFDGDGTFESSSGSNPVVVHPYYQAGNFTPVVRVTDNDGGTDTARGQLLNVTVGWHTLSVAQVTAHPQFTSIAEIPVGASATLAEVAYTQGEANPVQIVTADPADAASWSAPVKVSNENGRGAVALLKVTGYPAVFYQRAGNNGIGGLSYVLATSAQGASWGTPVDLDNQNEGIASTLAGAIVDGRPAVVYGADDIAQEQFIRASDSAGSAWPAGAMAFSTSGLMSSGVGLLLANGNPAIAGINGTGNFASTLYFDRSSDTDGTAWAATPDKADPMCSHDFTGTIGAAVVNGRPALVYSDWFANGLTYLRATDSSGSDWLAPVSVIPGDDDYTCIRLIDNAGKPAVVCQKNQSDLLFIPAKNINGSAWGNPQLVDSAGDVGQGCSAINASGTLIISYFDTTNSLLKIAYR